MARPATSASRRKRPRRAASRRGRGATAASGSGSAVVVRRRRTSQSRRGRRPRSNTNEEASKQSKEEDEDEEGEGEEEEEEDEEEEGEDNDQDEGEDDEEEDEEDDDGEGGSNDDEDEEDSDPEEEDDEDDEDEDEEGVDAGDRDVDDGSDDDDIEGEGEEDDEEEEGLADEGHSLLYAADHDPSGLDEDEDAFLAEQLAVASADVAEDIDLLTGEPMMMSLDGATQMDAEGAGVDAMGTTAMMPSSSSSSSSAAVAASTAQAVASSSSSSTPAQEYMPAYRLKSKVGPSGLIEPRDESTYLAAVPDLVMPSIHALSNASSAVECVYDPSLAPEGGARVDSFLRRAVQRLVAQRAEPPAVPALDLASMLAEDEENSESDGEASDGGDSKMPSSSSASRPHRPSEAAGAAASSSSSPPGGIPKNSIVSRLGGVVEVAEGGPGRKRTRSSSSTSALDIPPKLSPRSLRRRIAARVAEIARRTTATGSSADVGSSARGGPAARRVMFVDGALVLLHPSILDILMKELKDKNFDEERALEAVVSLQSSASVFSIWSVREQHAFLSAYIRFGDNIERVYREIVGTLRNKAVRDVVDYYYRCVCPAAKLEEDYPGLRKEVDSRASGARASLYRPYITHAGGEAGGRAAGDHMGPGGGGGGSGSGVGMRTRGRAIVVPGEHAQHHPDGDFSLVAAARFIRHARGSLDTFSFSQAMNSILLSSKGIISPAELVVRIRRICCQAVYLPQASVGPAEMLREFLALLPEPARRSLLSSGLVLAVDTLTQHSKPAPVPSSSSSSSSSSQTKPAPQGMVPIAPPRPVITKTAVYRSKATEEVII